MVLFPQRVYHSCWKRKDLLRLEKRQCPLKANRHIRRHNLRTAVNFKHNVLDFSLRQGDSQDAGIKPDIQIRPFRRAGGRAAFLSSGLLNTLFQCLRPDASIDEELFISTITRFLGMVELS